MQPLRLMYALAFLSLAILALWPTKVEARNQALLIGISNYTLESIPKLKAPKNDVALMWDLLQEHGFHVEDITVLADKIDPDHKRPIPHALPTADNILRELDALAARTEKNDMIVVYYRPVLPLYKTQRQRLKTGSGPRRD